MRLRETTGDSMGIHDTQSDYWTLMRTIRTHETQRLMETNGDS